VIGRAKNRVNHLNDTEYNHSLPPYFTALIHLFNLRGEELSIIKTNGYANVKINVTETKNKIRQAVEAGTSVSIKTVAY